jgi:hypothetical protein
MKSALAAGLLLSCLATAAGCTNSSSSTAHQATTETSPTPTSTVKNFQLSTPNGQVSLSLDGQLPPNWPGQFPIPSGTRAAGSGSLGGSASTVLVAVYTASMSAPDAFAFYTNNTRLTTSGLRSVGAGARYVGSATITAPYTGSVTVISRSGTTQIVVVLRNPGSSPSASPAAS